jgi:hypothetical protein
MSRAVNFDGQLMLDAEGIQNETAVRVLAAEFKARQAAVAQSLPEPGLHGRWLAALGTSCDDDFGGGGPAPRFSQDWPVA